MTLLPTSAPPAPPALRTEDGLEGGRAADALAAELEELVRLGDAGRRRLVAASVQVASVDPFAIVEAALGLDEVVAFFCRPADGRVLVGIGEATSFALEGSDGFERAESAWRELTAGAVVAGPAGPLLLGGAAFAPGSPSDSIWGGFGSGWLRLPKLLLAVTPAGWSVTASAVLDPGTDPETEIAALACLTARVLGPGGGPPASDRAGLAGVETDEPPGREARLPRLEIVARRPDRRTWEAAVARAAGAVGRGRLDKVVLARRVDLAADRAFDVPFVLRRLAGAAPGSTTFAFAVGAGEDRKVFLGASPERLVAVEGRTFRTIALAGTIGRDPDPAADEALAAALLASEKDREEHAVVVEMLRTTLAPLVERLELESSPHVLRLPTVHHLATEVGGRLRDDVGVLALVARLHPTPAVGGWPRELALDYIAEEEGLERGWYAGPVGWLDGGGDGEFVVGIRSAVVAGSMASLFAGCGIVADSEPEQEWIESELKLEAVAGALGSLVR